MELTDERIEFLQQVKDLYATGMRQQDVAVAVGKSLGAVRSRLRTAGLKFGRAGRIVQITPVSLDMNAKRPQ